MPARTFPTSTRPLLHSSSKLRRYSAARFAEGTRRITFSSRVHESLVQLVEPVQTAAVSSPASRTTYLWCISEGTPGTGRLGTPRAAMKAVSGSGGGGTGIGFGKSTLYKRRIATPRWAAALTAWETSSAGGPSRCRS